MELTRIAVFTWRVSDCEELSGGLLTGDDGVGFRGGLKRGLILNRWQGSVRLCGDGVCLGGRFVGILGGD